MKMVDIQKAIDQTHIILLEHSTCQDLCETLGTFNKYDHKRAMAAIIGYYMLGLANG